MLGLDRFPVDTVFLLAGCGGGYDCFTGLPLYFSLMNRYKNVHMVNLSFSKHLDKFPRLAIDRCCFVVNSTVASQLADERSENCCEYMLSQQIQAPVYCFRDEGLVKYRASFESLVRTLGANVVILCDGGCDSIMTGREPELGTPVEDVMSMLAVHSLQNQGLITHALLLLLGATVDTFVEIRRQDFFANLQQLSKDLIETAKLAKEQPEVQRYIQVFESCEPWRSIVNASICASLDGLTGSGVLPPLILKYPQFNRTLDPDRFLLDDYVRTYYLFSLSPVLSRIVYLDLIEHLDDSDDIDRVIMDFHMQQHKTEG